jgi:hypothetical protein
MQVMVHQDYCVKFPANRGDEGLKLTKAGFMAFAKDFELSRNFEDTLHKLFRWVSFFF